MEIHIRFQGRQPSNRVERSRKSVTTIESGKMPYTAYQRIEPQVKESNAISILAAGRGRWFIEDHFNTQKNRGGNLHHKFNRKNLFAIKNWHNARQLACAIEELVKHTAELQQLKNENQKLTWKALWENMNSYLTMLPVEEQMTEFEHWSKSQRQVRLE